MNQLHSYFYCHRVDNHLTAYHRRYNDITVDVYRCVVSGAVNKTELFSFVGDLISDIEEGYTPVSMNSLRDDLMFVTENIPDPIDGIAIAFNHIDLEFHAITKIGTGNFLISYGLHEISLNYPESQVGYAMLDHIRDVATGQIQLQARSEWAEDFSIRYEGLRTSERFQRESMVNIDLQPLRRVGEIFITLNERDRIPKLYSDHYRWMFLYMDEMKREVEKLLT